MATLGLSSWILLLIRPGLDSKSRVQEEDVVGGRLRMVDLAGGMLNALFWLLGRTNPWTDGAARIRRKVAGLVSAIMLVES